ncbi:MAG: aminomethyl transferase family protein [Acidobacteria bacterium]|nr:aminomethyl transferase family protein [Acidobacteriota bacterium]
MLSIDHYRALRERTGLVDRSARGKIVVAGSDRGTYLHAMLTNDIAALKAGTGCYAAYLTAQGRMIADMCVYELGDVCLLDVHPSVKGTIVERLDQFVFSEDVRLGDVTDAFGSLGLYGPTSARVLSETLRGALAGDTASEDALAALLPFQNLRAPFNGEPAIVVAAGRAGVAGFEIYIDRRLADPLTRAVIEAGAEPVDVEATETIRIEAGLPAFTVDMDQDTIPLEAGIEREAISFTKGCYPGQEVVIRILHRGHGRVAKKLAGILVQAEEVPDTGDRVYVEDREVGRITSAAYSPSLLAPIALGYVQPEYLQPGTALAIAHGDHRLPAVVGLLPFVAPTR